MVDTNIRPAYVDVAEVCRDWGCSRSKGYAIIKQLSEQMKSENPRLLTFKCRKSRRRKYLGSGSRSSRMEAYYHSRRSR